MSFPAVPGDTVEIEVANFPENYTKTVQVDGLDPDGFLVLDSEDPRTESLFPWEGFEAGIYEVVEKA